MKTVCMIEQLKSQETVSNVMKHYYCMLQKDKADFKKELEAIVPEVKLGDRGRFPYRYLVPPNLYS